ncbi:bifunctional 4-hydroxy-2-oxoglutarate aldolase/2-dehydro-3-deoxy-phosphogluconate aldolase [Aquisalinus flavus]|uniref:Ketohydroxyglutarate aldolase n=1 Tax=Aquisalinus flavus TaxID=1526572 RepID=A0A8J2V6X4_9PROT|nr:bifunctional 4-hydroxy-2-oxoglutarate aldolase/2-dehydro-3-deoxy-phosphogluconate aldolase [Aquisalinus flavus]MBD0427045.1 bifunctional 4-hydroxy-2-oxoglutarate aldolase/2-dehydro-3-deoxy-phosphogluconate aldolase [Aquisalinus flavus]UNE46871.1 bifunctional 4-hydroxy-2-oxoglutarate aldolase/2-dehydro-3-deoxy-phosphogluconate aldolase [Aquisalinus flavus]GGC97942.1 ketohydroxyglutarate aldolase [Aquisalinus flavus]
MTIDTILDKATIIPVIEIADAGVAGDLARAFLDGGLEVIELTMRTPAALDALAAIKKAAPSLITGMGTVLNEADYKASVDHGADFIVSPGITLPLLSFAETQSVPILPGIATASEAMTAMDHGFTALKFFPAEVAGGAPYIKALGGPLKSLRFCPTGGVSPDNAKDYLSLPNVVCAGGSWIATRQMIDGHKWDEITATSKAAVALYKEIKG